MNDDRRPDLPHAKAPTEFEPEQSEVLETPGTSGTIGLYRLLQRLGDFELLRELGRGGMGIVYEARQLSLKRRVALKVLPPALGMTAQAKQRFEREAQAAAKLHHTNIVPVHAIGEHDGHHFYAMDLIDGQSLDHVLRDMVDTGSNPLMKATVTQTVSELRPQRAERPSRDEATTSLSDTSAGGREWFDTVAKLMAEVADALHYAHGRGIIHRDIKPANLLLSKQGHLSITDFGLARLLEEPGMTVSGSFLGTPAYMAPEQIAAGRIKVDHRADIYSLGAVLYEMLTMQRPFAGQSREQVLAAVMTKDPRPPRRFNGKIPVDLETICLKALEKDPDRRYQSAGELAQDLRQYLQRGLIAARRAGIARRTWKSIRRYPVASTVILGMIALSMLGLVTWKTFLAHRQVDLQRLASDARLDLNRGDLQDALETANEILARKPSDIEGRLIRARVHFFRWRYWDAVDDAREVLRQDPGNREAHLLIAATAQYGELHSISVNEHLAAIEDLGTDTAEALFLQGFVAAYGMDTQRDAVSLLTRALEIDPGHVLALWARSSSYQVLKDFPAALADAERLVVAQPRSALGYIRKSRVYRHLHDEEAALEAANRAIELDNVSGDGYVERSRIHALRGNMDEEIADLTRAIKLNPTDTRYELRAYAHRSKHEYDRTIEDARQCLEINPDRAQCYHDMWAAYWSSGQRDKALSVIEELEAHAETWVSDMGRVSLRFMWMEQYRENGELERADDEATRIIELLPSFINGFAWRAEIRRRLSGREGVQEDCDRVIALDLDRPFDFYWRGNMMQDTCGRAQAALSDYAEAIRRAPTWADPYQARANVFLVKKQNEMALADLDRAVELTPNWGQAVYWRGLAFEAMERFEEALDQYETAAGLGAESQGLRFHQAIALSRLGRDEDALQVLRDFIERKPAHWPARIHLAIIYFTMGHVEEAVQTLDEALKIHPDIDEFKTFRAYFSAFGSVSCPEIGEHLTVYEKSMSANPSVWRDVAMFHGIVLASICPELHDPARALDLARKSVDYDPDDHRTQSALGISLYRIGRNEEAKLALLRSLELEQGGKSSRILFALAMTYWKLGERETALERYREGVAQAEKSRNRRPDMIMLRGEAAELLGIEP